MTVDFFVNSILLLLFHKPCYILFLFFMFVGKNIIKTISLQLSNKCSGLSLL